MNELNRKFTVVPDGLLSPEIARCNSLCRKFKKREYKFSQQKQCARLVTEIIFSREVWAVHNVLYNKNRAGCMAE